MEPVFGWISQYGYGALFLLLVLGIVGLPVPDETLLAFCGYLVWKGNLRYPLVLLTAFAGSCCGISISYLLGRYFALGVITRYGRYLGFTHQRVAWVNRIFERLGPWLLSCGYFIPGIRHFTALVAGMSGLRYGVFAIFAYLGAAVWVTAFVSMGYQVGDTWQKTSARIHHIALITLLVLSACAALLWTVQRLRPPSRNSG